jgi:hypothetical protein
VPDGGIFAQREAKEQSLKDAAKKIEGTRVTENEFHQRLQVLSLAVEHAADPANATELAETYWNWIKK